MGTSCVQQRSRVRRLRRRPTPLRGVFFHSNTSCVQQRSRVRRLSRRPTPLRGVFSTATPCACNNDRVCGGFAAALRSFAAFFPQQHLVRLTTIACAAASPPAYAASRRFFHSNTSCVQQRSRVRRLRRRPTPLCGVFSTATPCAFNNDRVCGGFAADLRRFAAFFPQENLGRLTTIACAAALPPPYAASRRFYSQQHLMRAT